MHAGFNNALLHLTNLPYHCKGERTITPEYCHIRLSLKKGRKLHHNPSVKQHCKCTIKNLCMHSKLFYLHCPYCYRHCLLFFPHRRCSLTPIVSLLLNSLDYHVHPATVRAIRGAHTRERFTISQHAQQAIYWIFTYTLNLKLWSGHNVPWITEEA